MLRSLSLAAIAIAALSACSDPVDPCEGVSCGKGRCVLDRDRPACECDANHRPYSFTLFGEPLQVRLKDANGNMLNAFTSTPTVITLKAGSTGTWYAEVLARSGGPTTGSYTFALADLGPDDHGDTVATATPLPGLGAWVPGRLELASDVDFFSISLAASTAYQVVTTGASVNVTLFNPSGLAFTAEGVTPFGFTTGAAGTYYVRLRSQFEGGANYQLRVQ